MALLRDTDQEMKCSQLVQCCRCNCLQTFIRYFTVRIRQGTSIRTDEITKAGSQTDFFTQSQIRHSGFGLKET